ncbi:lysine-rich arabinogalactan protein 19-like [Salvia hispanica]|uniref:lysine-rich arabinogalactan protein 19-like n=1 Tax=Salvia hispanica TaxID=49212 RepID=UPI002008F2F9|nr:lysine-rich arabinogalactan protein 19-like [Salvia hispanica]
MASISPILVFSLLLSAYPVLSDQSPSHSPSLPPHPSSDEISPPPASLSSPPAPPPPDLGSPSPSPAPIADSKPYAADLDSKEDSTGGMSGGQKAGLAVGVITGAFVVGAGVVVYKKRQHNIQRSQYGYAARREIL